MKKFLITYPVSIVTVIVIWYLCFFTPPSTGLDNVIGFDKVVHFGMYAFLGSVIQWERRKSTRSIVISMILPILMSGAIEILQETCTGGRRSGEIWDFVANSLGAISAWFVFPLFFKLLKK